MRYLRPQRQPSCLARRPRLALTRIAFAVACTTTLHAAHAQVVDATSPQVQTVNAGQDRPAASATTATTTANQLTANVNHQRPLPDERLSDYLLRIAPEENTYPFAAEWSTPESRLAQEALHRSLLLAVSNVPSNQQVDSLTSEEQQRWRNWLTQEQPRGRVLAPSFDARWLAANPRLDPILQPTHRVTIPSRPTTVAVIQNTGGVCHVQFQPNRSALDYAKQCGEPVPTAERGLPLLSAQSNASADWAYVIQPDGEIFKFGLGLWNETSQVAPAPGAWIWIPEKNRQWPDGFTNKLTEFLSHQGASTAHTPAIQTNPTTDRAAANTSAAPLANTVLSSKQLQLNAEPTKPLDHYRDLDVSPSDWGSIGLLQTPSARFSEAGTGTISFSHTEPYTRANVILTPFDWLEAGFRYVDISNRLYGETIAGSQSYKDKSIDAKFRLTREGEFMPQIAVGMRDLGGTGLFSGEYVVANKRFGPIDASLGMGWGYVGGRGNLSNPLRVFSERFATRPQGSTGSAQGGEFNAETYFRGPVALFGGVQIQSPWHGWTFKVEVDGNDYRNEPQSNNQSVDSPINVGAVYRLGPHTQFTVGLERGNTVMLGVSFGTNLGKLSTPKVNEARPLPVQLPRRATAWAELPADNWNLLIQTLESQTGWDVRAISRREKSLRVEIAMAPTFNWEAVIDRANGAMHAIAPAEISRFTYVVFERGLPVTEFSVERDAWAQQATSFVPPTIRLNQPQVVETWMDEGPVRPSMQDERVITQPQEPWAAGIGLAYSQSLGGPDAFILFQLSAQAEVEWRPTENTWFTGVGNLALIDNYDKFKYTGPSQLPRVRTNIREYVTSSDVTIPVLQGTHTRSLSDSWSASVYGGLLESMYAGVGGELLYRPFGSDFALGFDVNRVRQRGFQQDFSLRDYEVTTGHATLYWHTGWEDILAKVSAGQYLAGDKGVTVDLSRVFPNGVRIGAFATKTDVSAAQFGEGSFDKGIYVTIPFDAMMTKFSKSEALLQWQPLTRDGGAKLNRRFELYEMTKTKN